LPNLLFGSNREKLEIIAKNASFLSDILNTILDFKELKFPTQNSMRKD